MRILILGGTVFLGRHVVDAGRVAGHDVTLFHRGRSNPGLFPELEHVLGDRDGGLDALGDRTFDAVIDTSGYVPRIVGASARRFADCGHYCFVSSGSVYPHPVAAGTDETAPVIALVDPTTEEIKGETYGGLKALCEQAVHEVFGDRGALLRAGLIVGPHDPSDRFTYWPARCDRGGVVLCPPDRDAPVQWIDVRDLATWIVHLAEQRVGGTFNALGPSAPATFGELIDACANAVDQPFETVWANAELLEEHGVAPWSDLPLWVPADNAGFQRMANARALATGLALRPLSETVRDTLGWHRTRGDDVHLKAGLSPEREAQVLALRRTDGET